MYQCTGAHVVNSVVRTFNTSEYTWWSTHGRDYYRHLKNRGTRSLAAFRQAVEREYSDHAGPEEARMRLYSLRQGADHRVSQYKGYFDLIVAQLPPEDRQNTGHLLKCFRQGLRENIRVLMDNSCLSMTNLDDVFQAALDAEHSRDEISGGRRKSQFFDYRQEQRHYERRYPRREGHDRRGADGPTPMDLGRLGLEDSDSASDARPERSGPNDAGPRVARVQPDPAGRERGGGRGSGRGGGRGRYGGRGGGRGRQGRQDVRAGTRCFNCNKTGHWENECSEKQGPGGAAERDFRGRA